jgi:hypothetical protein
MKKRELTRDQLNAMDPNQEVVQFWTYWYCRKEL